LSPRPTPPLPKRSGKRSKWPGTFQNVLLERFLSGRRGFIREWGSVTGN
jgi:hypothetical protein